MAREPTVKYEVDDDGNVVEADELDVKPDIEAEADIKPKARRGRKRAASDNDNGTDEKPLKRAKPQTRAPRTGGPGKRWTGPELEQLLLRALQGGPPQSAFNDAIPGRTASQCAMTWRNSILPYLKKCLHERGQAGASAEGKE